MGLFGLAVKNELHSGNGAFKHAVVRLIRGQTLHLQTGPQNDFNQGVFRMRARPFHSDFISNTRDNRHEDNARQNDKGEFRSAIGNAPGAEQRAQWNSGIHEDGDDHDHD